MARTLSPIRRIGLQLAIGTLSLGMLMASNWYLEQMRIRHLQSMQTQRDLDAEVKRQQLLRDAARTEREMLQLAKDSQLDFRSFSDRQVDMTGLTVSRDRINALLMETLGANNGFFVVEAFSLETANVHEGLFNSASAGSSTLPVLTLKGRQFFPK